MTEKGKNADSEMITVMCGSRNWSVDRSLLLAKSTFFKNNMEKSIEIADIDPETVEVTGEGE